MGLICAIQMKTAMEMDFAKANIVFACPTMVLFTIAHIMDVTNTNIFKFHVFSLVANDLIYILYYFLIPSY